MMNPAIRLTFDIPPKALFLRNGNVHRIPNDENKKESAIRLAAVELVQNLAAATEGGL